MKYFTTFVCPVGKLTLTADENALTGILFDGEKFLSSHAGEYERKETPVLREALRWLDIYFHGKEPDFSPPLRFNGTAFQNEVWEILLTIPYGKTVTYGEIAKKIAQKRGIARMSAQAVGGAVGHNAIPIIIPCHRVMGGDGSLTGYTGGIDKKICFLRLEGVLKD